MKDLTRLTKAQLIERLQALESGESVRCEEPGVRRASRTQLTPDTSHLAPPTSALRDADERLRAILETAVEGIITIDERGLIESVNSAAEQTFGYQAREIIGKNVSLLMPSPYRAEHDSYLANYRRTGHAKIIGIGREVVGRRKDGSSFPMDLSVSEVRLADRRLFTGFVRDISQRKRLEKEILEISDREQRRIGHDLHDGLCQQLAGIELMSQVLEQKLVAKSKAKAARAAEIARHVRDAIGHTRLLARGLSPVTLESEGLMSALEELAADTGKMFQVACVFECESPVLVHDHAAATQLYRIAQEAVSNAIKHGKARRIVISLQWVGEQNVLAIKDDGVGLPNFVPKTGMGLRIMQYRAGMIGGAAMVQRDLDGGTSVVCSAPRTLEKGQREGT